MLTALTTMARLHCEPVMQLSQVVNKVGQVVQLDKAVMNQSLMGHSANAAGGYSADMSSCGNASSMQTLICMQRFCAVCHL